MSTVLIPARTVSPFQLANAIHLKRNYNWFHICSPLNANAPIGVETALSSIQNDLEWLSKDLRSLDWFNWSGYKATEVNKESGDNTCYLQMIQASPTEWSILNTVRLSFLSASGGKPVISHWHRVFL